jgi:hypothetical protein
LSKTPHEHGSSLISAIIGTEVTVYVQTDLYREKFVALASQAIINNEARGKRFRTHHSLVIVQILG